MTLPAEPRHRYVLTADELAALIGVGAHTVRAMSRTGQIPSRQLLGQGKRLYWWPAVAQALKAGPRELPDRVTDTVQPEILTSQELAHGLGLEPAVVDRLAAEGHLASFQLTTTRRYPSNALDLSPDLVGVFTLAGEMSIAAATMVEVVKVGEALEWGRWHLTAWESVRRACGQHADILTVDQLSAKIGLSKLTIWGMVTEGSLPGSWQIGKEWRFSWERIKDWIRGDQSADTGMSLESVANTMRVPADEIELLTSRSQNPLSAAIQKDGLIFNWSKIKSALLVEPLTQEHLGVADVAILLGFTEPTVTRLASAGELPCIRDEKRFRFHWGRILRRLRDGIPDGV